VRKSYLPFSILVFLVFALSSSPMATAATSGEIELFDGIIYDFTSVDLYTVTFVDGGDGKTAVDSSFAAAGLGYYQSGSGIAGDRLYICDETDGGGEDVVMLIGPNATTYQFDSSSTLDFVMDRDAGGRDPHPVEWVSDVSDGTILDNDWNVWVVRISNFEITALDQDGFLGAGSFSDFPSGAQTDGIGLMKGSAGCKNVAGTRMYIGGVREYGGGDNRYAYQVLDLTTGTLVSDYVVLLPEVGTPFGPGPDPGIEPWHHAFHAMATDRENGKFYCMVKNGSEGLEERWLYRFDNLPDPSATDDITYTEGGVPKVRLDTVLTFNKRPDRSGMCTGRTISTGIGAYPVIYIVNGDDVDSIGATREARLYTLVPRVLQPGTDVGTDTWGGYR
jgi:hypothetical protein